VVSKLEDTDSDGQLYYKLVLSGPKGTWVKIVSPEDYLITTKETKLQAVYLEGRKNPILHYDLDGYACG